MYKPYTCIKKELIKLYNILYSIQPLTQYVLKGAQQPDNKTLQVHFYR